MARVPVSANSEKPPQYLQPEGGFAGPDDLPQSDVQRHQLVLASEAELALMSFERDRLYGDQGFFSLQGKAAVSAKDQVIADWQSRYESLRKSLPSRAARARFQARVDGQVEAGLASIRRHGSEQLNVWQQDQRQGAIRLHIDNAIRAVARDGAPDMAEIRLQVKLADIGIAEAARLEGWPPAKTQHVLAETRSTIHHGVLDRLLAAGSTELAREYFDVNQAQLTDADRQRTEPELQNRETQAAPVARANQIWQGAEKALPLTPGEEVAGLARQLAHALPEVEKLDDPDMRERARHHLILQHRRLTAEARQARRRLWGTALNQVENGSGPDDLPLPLRDALGRDALHRLHRYASTGGNHETDGAGYTAIARLLDMPARDFVELDFSEYADRLSRTDRNRLSARQDLIRKQINGDHTTFDPLNHGTRRRLATLFEHTGMTGLVNRGPRAELLWHVAGLMAQQVDKTDARDNTHQMNSVIDEITAQFAGKRFENYAKPPSSGHETPITPATRQHLITLFARQYGHAPDENTLQNIFRDWRKYAQECTEPK